MTLYVKVPLLPKRGHTVGPKGISVVALAGAFDGLKGLVLV